MLAFLFAQVLFFGYIILNVSWTLKIFNMALGKSNEGNKGSKHSEAQRVLLSLGMIAESVTASAATGATEGTLLSILNNMVASQDVEILLVRDTGNADLVVQQIREYDQGTGLWTTRYEKVDGSAYVPPELVGPLEYLDPSAVLNLVLAELVLLNAGGQLSTEATLAAFSAKFVATERVPGMLRVTSAGAASVTAGKKSVAVWNYGTTDAEWLGQPLLPGEKLSWSVEDQGDTLGAFDYNALTSSLLITYKS